MFTTTIRAASGLAVAIVVLSFAPASGQNSEETRSTLSGIEGVAVFVDSMSIELYEAGIRPHVVLVEIERVLKQQSIRMLSAGSPAAPGSPTLYVEVLAALQDGPEAVAYSIRVELMQSALLEREPAAESRLVTTWSTGGTVLFGKGWRQALIGDVAAYTQEFAQAYWESNLERVE